MLLLSRYPLDAANARTFQHLRWSSVPDARRPRLPDADNDWHSDAVWRQLPLSSKSHWDVPVDTPLGRLHVLASHPTPPVFDGPEKRNARNHDEIRLWAEYLNGGQQSWLIDDQGRVGGWPARRPSSCWATRTPIRSMAAASSRHSTPVAASARAALPAPRSTQGQRAAQQWAVPTPANRVTPTKIPATSDRAQATCVSTTFCHPVSSKSSTAASSAGARRDWRGLDRSQRPPLGVAGPASGRNGALRADSPRGA